MICVNSNEFYIFKRFVDGIGELYPSKLFYE